jgi:SAM-dependent methyltransferase
MTSATFACPRCRGELQPSAPDGLVCPADDLRFEHSGGIWRFLLPERQAHYAQFIHEYETIRKREGRTSTDPAYYRSLPYRDLSGRMSPDWRIRAVSYDAFVKKVLAPLETTGQPLSILDLGAGNGWLSNRLALRGHQVTAVDLTVNDFDGLGCHRFYASSFTPVQAEFDHLPLPDAFAGLVVFNASLHYSESYPVTLTESLRVLEPEGRLVILDTPVYHQAESGAQMVRERETRFEQDHGFPSRALSSENYLSYGKLDSLGKMLGLHWHLVTPNYGLAWKLRPLKARLLRRREPASFQVMVARRA